MFKTSPSKKKGGKHSSQKAVVWSQIHQIIKKTVACHRHLCHAPSSRNGCLQKYNRYEREKLPRRLGAKETWRLVTLMMSYTTISPVDVATSRRSLVNQIDNIYIYRHRERERMCIRIDILCPRPTINFGDREFWKQHAHEITMISWLKIIIPVKCWLVIIAFLQFWHNWIY